MKRLSPAIFGLALCVLAAVVAGGTRGASALPSLGSVPALGFPSVKEQGAQPAALPVRQGSAAGQGIFGFDLHDERIYVMGPPETLAAGEMATWVIRLDRIEGEGRSLRAVFGLQHERKAPHSRDYLPPSGAFRISKVYGELVVNAYGVPLELRYVSQRYFLDAGEEIFEVGYELDKDRYRKDVRVDGGDWDLKVDITEHPSLDLKVPEGLFVAAPSSIACLEWAISGGANAEACNELNVDPTFANPGLLSLLLPALKEAGGDTELLLFTPTRPDLTPGGSGGIPLNIVPIVPGIPGVGGGSIFPNGIPGLDWGRFIIGGSKTSGDKDRAEDPARYFQTSRMYLRERSPVEVGPRTVEAMELRMSTYPHAIWVDEKGKVLRVDMTEEAPAGEDRWLRLLFPSEY
jgi:hypothetical protein